jgi:hypothetical protein
MNARRTEQTGRFGRLNVASSQNGNHFLGDVPFCVPFSFFLLPLPLQKMLKSKNIKAAKKLQVCEFVVFIFHKYRMFSFSPTSQNMQIHICVPSYFLFFHCLRPEMGGAQESSQVDWALRMLHGDRACSRAHVKKHGFYSILNYLMG